MDSVDRECYQAAGEKAGRAAKHGDWPTVRFHIGWFNKAQAGNRHCDEAQQVFRAAYMSAAVTQPSTNPSKW